MGTVCVRGVLLCLIPLVCGAAPQPADWTPARWDFSDVRSLDLLANTPVNCLLLEHYTREFAAGAAERGIVTLAVIRPGGDAAEQTRGAVAAKLAGVVLEGDFPAATVDEVKRAATGAAVIELSARANMKLAAGAPVIGTYQGVWPGIQVEDAGAVKAGPTGSTWIDTNTGFIRAVRAWGNSALWIGNRPPPQTIVGRERYLQAIADAAMSGARWVLALDDDFAARLEERDEAALGDWQAMARLLRYFEAHPEWRAMRPYGKLAVVQDPAKGGLLSGGILDMIAVKHTPVRPVPRQRLSAEALQGASMAVNVDADSLTPEQAGILKEFTRSGGTLLTGPPGWKDQAAGERITLEKPELDRLNTIWHDMQSMIGRRNLGVRLFNVSSMLSNLLASDSGKQAVVQLVNYSGYPVENVTVQILGSYKRATLLTPEGVEKALEIYETEDGGGVDIDKVFVCATVRLEQ